MTAGDLKTDSIMVAKDIVAELAPDEVDSCEILVDEYCERPEPAKAGKDRKMGFAFVDPVLLNDILVPIICGLVVETVKDYYRGKLRMHEELRAKAYTAALENGIPPETAEKLSQKLVASMSSHKILKPTK